MGVVRIFFYFIILAGLFFQLKRVIPPLPPWGRYRLVIIALFAYLFLVGGDTGFISLRGWFKYARQAWKADYASRYQKGYRAALAEAFPWYEDVVKARFQVLNQGEKSIRLECPSDPEFRKRVAEILYPVRVDTHSPLTLMVTAGPRYLFRLRKSSP
jgi:hypothetical protein